jgi:hypothetical protein
MRSQRQGARNDRLRKAGAPPPAGHLRHSTTPTQGRRRARRRRRAFSTATATTPHTRPPQPRHAATYSRPTPGPTPGPLGTVSGSGAGAGAPPPGFECFSETDFSILVGSTQRKHSIFQKADRACSSLIHLGGIDWVFTAPQTLRERFGGRHGLADRCGAWISRRHGPGPGAPE